MDFKTFGIFVIAAFIIGEIVLVTKFITTPAPSNTNVDSFAQSTGSGRGQFCINNPDKCTNGKPNPGQGGGGQLCQNNPQFCTDGRPDRNKIEQFCQTNPDKCTNGRPNGSGGRPGGGSTNPPTNTPGTNNPPTRIPATGSNPPQSSGSRPTSPPVQIVYNGNQNLTTPTIPSYRLRTSPVTGPEDFLQHYSLAGMVLVDIGGILFLFTLI